MDEKIRGNSVIKTLAEIYKQLYIEPSDDALEKYRNVVLRGNEPEKYDLSHFVTSERDTLEYADTPAGKVMCITLHERQDFITFLRIMGNRCAMADIPDTQGASILDGVINWKTINDHREEYFSENQEASDSGWNEEFKRFTSDKKNYTDALIILSVGPYSNTPASSVGIPEDEWIPKSHTIRKYHECTHFICRRKFPEKKDAIWDEVVADAVGIYAAFNRPDTDMEKKFLGIEGDHYIGGRLENYVEADTDEEKKEELDRLSARISKVLEGFEKIMTDNKGVPPFEMAVILEESMDGLWKKDYN